MVRVELQRIACALGCNVFADWNDLRRAAHAERGQLNFASALQSPENGKCLRQGGAPGQQAMVAQDDGLFVANAVQ